MKQSSGGKIFSNVEPADFIGRASHVDTLLDLARGRSGGITLLATPTAGLSELLRQTYDRLFNEGGAVIPFYFEVKISDASAGECSRRFLREFLLQTVAFRRADPRIMASSPDINEVADLALPADGHWIDRLVEMHSTSDIDSSIQQYLSAPIRAAANGARSFVMIDNAHTISDFPDGDLFLNEMCGVLGGSNVPFVISGHRRALFARTPFETMSVEAFSFAEAGTFIERSAASANVKINDQTRDLLAVQLGGNAGKIASLLASATVSNRDLNSFESVEQVYTDEIFGGRTSRGLDAILERAVPDAYMQERVLWLLLENLNANASRVPESYWQRHATRASFDLDSVLSNLHSQEIINRSGGSVDIDPTNVVLCDYLRGRGRIEIDRVPRALVVGEALSENIKRAPQLMARFYRLSAAVDLRSLMSVFDGRRIPLALIDYAKFKEEFKGADDEKILKAVKEDNSGIELPQIVYTASTSAFYPIFSELCDPERSATALGFADKDEIAWLAVQIDSKLEATRELAEFWCDRLEMAAANAEFSRSKFWLIAPEGFSPEALELLNERAAFGSSRKQIDLLAATLNADIVPGAKTAADEYEIVVPMGGDTEMIAAHTVEEIAKRHNFSAKSINQIKTALVEACINATEHSLSPDRRIHQKFSVDADKITISIANRGLRLADKQSNANAPNEGRRGWGLKLMKGLMDEVKIENTDDGTQITMVKYLEKSAAAQT